VGFRPSLRCGAGNGVGVRATVARPVGGAAPCCCEGIRLGLVERVFSGSSSRGIRSGRHFPRHLARQIVEFLLGVTERLGFAAENTLRRAIHALAQLIYVLPR